MLQIMSINGSNLSDLTQGINNALSAIKSNNPQVQVLNELSAVIIYEVEEPNKNCLCCDCQYWDDSNNSTGLVGLCHACGGRKRFSDKACDSFKDVRE